MASITVQGRFSKTPVAAMSKKDKPYAAASLAENSKKNTATGKSAVTWYDVVGLSPKAIAQMTAASPKDYVRVIGYPTANAFMRKNGENAAIIAINVVSVEVLPDTRPAAATAATVAIAPAADEPASTLTDDEAEF